MKQSNLKRLYRYLKPYRLLLVGSFLFALFQVLLTLCAPIVIGLTVDQIIGFQNVHFSLVFQYLIFLAFIYVGAALLQYAMTLCINSCCYKTVRDLRQACFRKFHQVSFKTLDNGQQGDFMNTMVNDIDMITDGLLQGFAQLFTGVITIFGTLGFMLVAEYRIALAVVLITPLSLFVASFIARHSSRLFKQQAAIKGKLSGFSEEMIENQSLVRLHHYQDRAEQRFDQINQEWLKVGTKVQFISSLTNPCTRFVNNLVYAVVGILGSFLALQGQITVGQLSSFLAYANQYTKPFNEISGVITELQVAFSSCDRVFGLLEQPEELDDAQGPYKEVCEGKMSLKDVSFSYCDDVPLIQDFSLKVTSGQKIAIVGPTGCGKTTLINLLMRFYDVNQGTIWLDDVETSQLKRDNLRQFFGMVLQDSWVFEGTIRDNIAYGNPTATKQDIENAAKKAHLDFFIRQLPQGYDTILGKNNSLSQGQKQLLCIARVLLCNPRILILDEATSSIDTRTEILVQQAFDEMMKGRTSFVVAHRLSTIQQADLILVMNQGQIVEQGNHQQLLSQQGFYANLYNSQFATE